MSVFEPTNQDLSPPKQSLPSTAEAGEVDILILLHPKQYSPDDYMAALLRHSSRFNSQPVEPENKACEFFRRNLQAQSVVELSPGHYVLAP